MGIFRNGEEDMRTGIAILLFLVVSSCTRYVYYGELESPDSSGKVRRHLVYWTRTERPLWFDEVSGSIRILTECSNRTVNFDETGEGIVFRRTPGDSGLDTTVALNESCGRILKYQRIKDIPEGDLKLELHCMPLTDEFSISNHKYLMARDSSYTVRIVRKEGAAFKSGTPERPECR